MLFIAFVVIKGSLGRSALDLFYEDRSARSFHGVVDSIYRQKDNHKAMTVVSKGSDFEIERVWEFKVKLSDSISKGNENN